MAFSADWLALRAPFDAAARDTGLNTVLADWLRNRATPSGEAIRAVDLGAGSGNNTRYLSRRLDLPVTWTLVDGDPRLLEVAQARHPDAGIVEADLSGDLDSLIPDGTDLVTASALIDLVSGVWLQRLVARVRDVGAALMVVLTYDGRIVWQEQGALDDRIRHLVNHHQRGDKGFGPTLGPSAPAELERLLDGHVQTGRSDWVIAAEDAAMRQALVDGWCGAAIEMAPAEADAVQAWRAGARDRKSALVVGHQDQLWLPTS